MKTSDTIIEPGAGPGVDPGVEPGVEPGIKLGKPDIAFGTDGWRAVIADGFTFENVRLVTQSIADYLWATRESVGGTRPTVVVGYDARFLSDQFARQAARVLVANRIRALVVDTDTPTPVVAFSVLHHGANGALMFTASHNPPEYSGVKFIPSYGGPADPEITTAIEAHLRDVAASGRVAAVDEDQLEFSGLFETISPKMDYFAAITTLVDLEAIRRSGISIIYDPLYGSGRHYVPEILAAAGCRVRTIHAHRDPLFGGNRPDPGLAQLAELSRLVREEEADLGLATDGDADRFGVVDAGGAYVTANQAIVLAFDHLIRKGLPGAAVRTVATTHLVDALARARGVDVVETPVGFKYVGAVMRRRSVIIGGEESGGFSIGPHIPEKDGILATLLLAEIRAKASVSLTRVLHRLMSEVGWFYHRRADVPVSEEGRRAFEESLRQYPPGAIGDVPVVAANNIDGLKLVLADDSWVLWRPSGTEPLVRVYVEAPSEELAEERMRQAREFLEVKKEVVAYGER